MHKAKLLLVLALVILPNLAQAQPNNTSIIDSLFSGFKNAPNMKEGVFVDFQHSRVLNILGVEIVNGSHFGSFWNNFTGDLDYIGQDGVGGSLDVNLAILPVGSFPILKLIQEHSYIGYGAGYRTLTTDGADGNPKSDNQFISGPTIFVKFNF